MKLAKRTFLKLSSPTNQFGLSLAIRMPSQPNRPTSKKLKWLFVKIFSRSTEKLSPKQCRFFMAAPLVPILLLAIFKSRASMVY